MGSMKRTIGIVLLVIGLIKLLNVPFLAGLVGQIIDVLIILIGLYLIIMNN
ncbi:MAG TPA: hypothetical protein VJG90_02740 [Candidatus Nanoarchaeia archaeon]|nr:hypothetical protein [Candidatus Nanoarchaeia archaeon]